MNFGNKQLEYWGVNPPHSRNTLLLSDNRFTENMVYEVCSGTLKVKVPGWNGHSSYPSRNIENKLYACDDYIIADPMFRQPYLNEGGLHSVHNPQYTQIPGHIGVSMNWTMENHTWKEREAGIVWYMRLHRKDPVERPSFSDNYRSIRENFIRDFYFEGLIANSIEPGSKITVTFSDTLINMGMALIVFTSEHEINTIYNPTSTTARDIVLEIIKTLHSLMKSDGFFVRDNAKSSNVEKLKKLRESHMHVMKCDETSKDNQVSVDQYVGIFSGLGFAYNYFKKFNATDRISGEICNMSKDLISKSFDWMLKDNFIIHTPEGFPVSRGEDATAFCTLFHGIYHAVTNIDKFDSINNGKYIGTIWDQCAGSISEVFRILHKDYVYQIHMAVMLLAPSEVWRSLSIESSTGGSHILSSLLNSYYHTEPPLKCRAPVTIDWRTVQKLLIQCPNSGPNRKEPVWNRDNFWVRGAFSDNHSNQNIAFNGLDFMVLHNLAKLIYHKH